MVESSTVAFVQRSIDRKLEIGKERHCLAVADSSSVVVERVLSDRKRDSKSL